MARTVAGWLRNALREGLLARCSRAGRWSWDKAVETRAVTVVCTYSRLLLIGGRDRSFPVQSLPVSRLH